MFFLASADAAGQPDVSYMGGAPGFVKALDARTLAFPSYDGNGLFRSLGNLLQNEHVALLFIDFEQPQRLHVLGRAAAADDDTLLACWPGAQLVVRVAVDLVATRRGPAGIAHGLAGMEVEARAATRHTGQLGQDAALGDGHLAV